MPTAGHGRACPVQAPFPSKLPLHIWEIWIQSNTWFLGPLRVNVPNGIANGSAAFAGLTVVTDRQTTLGIDITQDD